MTFDIAVNDDISVNNQRFVAALDRGDAAEMAECYTADGVLLPPGLPTVTGREHIAAFWRTGIESGLRSVKLETLSLQPAGEIAVEIGRATVLIEPDGAAAISDVGKYVVIHQRQPDGSWRWAIDIFNSDSAAG